MPAPERARAFAPGRVNLIGEHTDYNRGLALPFAISQGVVVDADAQRDRRVHAHADALGEDDEFALERPAPVRGWRAFVRGIVAELTLAGHPPPGARLRIGGDLPRGVGLSSSAALEVALSLALLTLAGQRVERTRTPDAGGGVGQTHIARYDLARLCSRVENEWAGAQTGLLDQLASLFGEAEHALRIDFATCEIEPVPLRLDGWRLVVLDSGERHTHAQSGYNRRREECAEACRELGVSSLREIEADGGHDEANRGGNANREGEADGEGEGDGKDEAHGGRRAAVERLPEPLRGRAVHVLAENERVREAVAALRAQNLPAVSELLNASHTSLRDLYDVSTPAVEAARERLLRRGASGARLIGGGFGGSVLALFAPGVDPPEEAREVRPGAGAHLLA